MRQREFIGGTEFSVSCASLLRHSNEASRYLSNCRRDGVSVNAVVLEVLKCHRQSAILFACVVQLFKLYPSKDAMAG
jgi:hypothetical protein